MKSFVKKTFQKLSRLFWGDVARSRRYLVLSILYISLLGVVSSWAKPRLDKWLFPQPPMAQGTCTQRVISISGFVPSGDLTAAREWVQTDASISQAFYVWNQERNRLELWMTDKIDFWELEVICFAIQTPGKSYVAKFGDFYKESFDKGLNNDAILKSEEINGD